MYAGRSIPFSKLSSKLPIVEEGIFVSNQTNELARDSLNGHDPKTMAFDDASAL